MNIEINEKQFKYLARLIKETDWQARSHMQVLDTLSAAFGLTNFQIAKNHLKRPSLSAEALMLKALTERIDNLMLTEFSEGCSEDLTVVGRVELEQLRKFNDQAIQRAENGPAPSLEDTGNGFEYRLLEEDVWVEVPKPDSVRKGNGLSVHITQEDEGVIVDLWPLGVEDAELPLGTCQVLFEEAPCPEDLEVSDLVDRMSDTLVAKGIEPEDLDELVHDLEGPERASWINNQGLNEQIRLILSKGYTEGRLLEWLESQGLLMEYLILSLSEQGYWSNAEGWVYDTASATVFTDAHLRKGALALPASKAGDARIVPASNAFDFDPALEEERPQLPDHLNSVKLNGVPCDVLDYNPETYRDYCRDAEGSQHLLSSVVLRLKNTAFVLRVEDLVQALVFPGEPERIQLRDGTTVILKD